MTASDPPAHGLLPSAAPPAAPGRRTVGARSAGDRGGTADRTARQSSDGSAVPRTVRSTTRYRRAVAVALAAAGVQPGDRIAGCMGNHTELVVAFLATMHLGAVWVGVNRALTRPEQEYVLDDAGRLGVRRRPRRGEQHRGGPSRAPRAAGRARRRARRPVERVGRAAVGGRSRHRTRGRRRSRSRRPRSRTPAGPPDGPRGWCTVSTTCCSSARWPWCTDPSPTTASAWCCRSPS